MEKFVYSFLKNTYLFELLTTVKQIIPSKTQGEILVSFADSIYHPQGGGQPNDKGDIVFEGKQYPIIGGVANRQTGEVDYRFKDEIPNLQIGKQVLMRIDKQYRIKVAKLHSAGHILDVAVSNLKLPWKPGKGYHFQDAPYVEYIGQFQDANTLKTNLQQQINKILKQSKPVQIISLSKEEAIQKDLISPQFSLDTVRVIKMFDEQCACGGTHIQNVEQITNIQITKINKKSKNVRVSYKI